MAYVLPPKGGSPASEAIWYTGIRNDSHLPIKTTRLIPEALNEPA